METQYKTGDWVKQYKHPKLWWIATLEATEWPMILIILMTVLIVELLLLL